MKRYIYTILALAAMSALPVAETPAQVPIALRFDPAARRAEGILFHDTYWAGTKGSARYTIFADSSARFVAATDTTDLSQPRPGLHVWDVSCGADAMTDERRCYVMNFMFAVIVRPGRIVLEFTSEYGLTPGSRVSLRFDGEPPVTAPQPGWRGPAADALLRRMIAARRVRTRTYPWPQRSAWDEEIVTGGLAEAIQYARLFVAGPPA